MDSTKALSVEKSNPSKVCAITVFGVTTCYEGDFEIKPLLSVKGNSYQQTLIYSGRVGNKINVSYREFSNNLARPAFNNAVEYDLSTSRVIGYKGSLLEVLNADNSSITYTLLKNFP